MKSLTLRYALAGLVLVAMTWVHADSASAQCATCPAPTVAYQPVVAQPTVAYRPYTGWYPGKWLDRWRMRRAGIAAPVPAYTAAYAPTYTAAYAPTYSAAYAPSNRASYTAAYRPYVTSFAPLSAPAAAPCNTCTQTAYYPVMQTVARPVLMRPVIAAPACNTCSFTPACGCNACSTGCDACSTGVSQAAYTEPACSSCAGGAVTSVVPQGNSGLPSVGPPTGQPSMAPPEAAPADTQYRGKPSVEGSSTRESEVPAGSDMDPLKDFDPGPTATEEDSSTFYSPPLLRDPRDRTARSTNSSKPTVDVWNAVYRGPATNRKVSPTSTRTRARTQAEIDADGWVAVPRNR